ncbi:hypothetical protein HYX08_00725 [Candidatus Woesearchaeota archaeon]|nr:hypothetical protein [Candidatus Woesearchaeota archaeon]
MLFNNKLIEILREVINSLTTRREPVPSILIDMYDYCNKQVKANDYKVKKFQKLFEQCRAKLMEMAKGGYLYFRLPDDEKKFFERITNYAVVIINSKKLSEDYNSVVAGKISPEKFSKNYKINYVGTSNIDQRQRDLKAPISFETRGDGLYMAISLRGNVYAFVPRFSLQFDDFHYGTYGMSNVFYTIDFKRGFVFNQVLMVYVALAEFIKKEWRLLESGRIKLKDGVEKLTALKSELDLQILQEIIKKCSVPGALFGKHVNLTDEEIRQVGLAASASEQIVKNHIDKEKDWEKFQQLRKQCADKGWLISFTFPPVWLVDGGETDVELKKIDKVYKIVVPSRVFKLYVLQYHVKNCKEFSTKPREFYYAKMARWIGESLSIVLDILIRSGVLKAKDTKPAIQISIDESKLKYAKEKFSRIWGVFTNPYLLQLIGSLSPQQKTIIDDLAKIILDDAVLLHIIYAKPNASQEEFGVDHLSYGVRNAIRLPSGVALHDYLFNLGKDLAGKLPLGLKALMIHRFGSDYNTVHILPFPEGQSFSSRFVIIKCEFITPGGTAIYDRNRTHGNGFCLIVKSNSRLIKFLTGSQHASLFTFALRNAAIIMDTHAAVFLDSSIEGYKSSRFAVLSMHSMPRVINIQFPNNKQFKKEFSNDKEFVQYALANELGRSETEVEPRDVERIRIFPEWNESRMERRVYDFKRVERILSEANELINDARILAYGGIAYVERWRIGNWPNIPLGAFQDFYGLESDNISFGVGELKGKRFIILRQNQNIKDRGGVPYTLLFDPGEAVWKKANHNAALIIRNILNDQELRHLFLERPEELHREKLVAIISKLLQSDWRVNPTNDSRFLQLWKTAASSSSILIIGHQDMNRLTPESLASLLAPLQSQLDFFNMTWLIGGGQANGRAFGCHIVWGPNREPAGKILPKKLNDTYLSDSQHRFLVRGTYYHGKPVNGTTKDFRDFLMDGEHMDDYIKRFGHWVLGFWNFSPKVMLYNPEGKDYIYGFNAHWGTIDATGRRGGETLTLKTSKEMNIYEYLLTLKSLMIGVGEIYNPNPREPLYNVKLQEPLKLYTIEPYDKRFLDSGGSERTSAYIIHVEPGKYVNSAPETIQKVQEEIFKNANPNEIIATLIYGENAFVGPDGLAAISGMTNMLPHIRWIGIINHPNKGYIDFEGILTFTTKIQQPGVFYAGQRLLRARSRNCDEFVKKVLGKFGSRDAKLHILFDTVHDLERRRTIVSLYCDGQIDKIRAEYSDALNWIRGFE